MRKIIAALTAVIYGVMLTATPILAATTTIPQIQASVTVEKVCDLNINKGTLNFGSPLPGTTSNSDTVTLTNNGNTAITSLKVSGNDWSAGVPTMPVGQTEYDDNDDSVFTKLTLGGTNVFGGTLADNAYDNVDFHVVIPTDQAAATYSQAITFTFGC